MPGRKSYYTRESANIESGIKDIDNFYKRILLIDPKKVYKKKDFLSPCTLGLEYVAASVEDIADRVMIVDLECEKLPMREIIEFSPDLVGMPMFTYQYNHVVAIAETLKESLPKSPDIVAGSNHPTVCPDEVLSNSCIDFAVRGEGEITFRELVSGTSLGEIKGLSFKRDGQIIHNPDREFIKDLGTIPRPARHLRRHPEKYHLLGFRIEPLLASRGCPNRCTFCSAYSMYKGIWRARPVEDVVDEMSFLEGKYKPRMLFFWDLDFLVGKSRLEEFCRLVSKKGLKTNFVSMARVDSVLRCRDILSDLRRAGLCCVPLGVETPDEDKLKDLKKDATVDQGAEAVGLLRENDIFPFSFILAGFPDDDRQSFTKTVSYAGNIGLDFLLLMYVTPLPGTPFFDEMKENNLIESSNWDDYNLTETPVLKLNRMTRNQLSRYMILYSILYSLNPKRAWRLFRFYRMFQPGIKDYFKFIGYALRYLRNLRRRRGWRFY